MSAPDFEALRAERNRKVEERMQQLASELGISWESAFTTFDPNACYCACSSGGPCEHIWDGPIWVSEDGCIQSATCSRCGYTAIGHDMRVLQQ